MTGTPDQVDATPGQRAVKSRPDDVNSWLLLSQECHDSADYEGAISAAQSAVAIAPQFGPAVRRLADALLYSGYRIHESEEWYRHLLDVEPGDAAALAALYYFSLSGERHAQALQYAAAADQAHPGDVENVIRIARAFSLLGDRPAADHHYRRAEAMCEGVDESLPPPPLAALRPVLARSRGEIARSEALSDLLCSDRGLWLSDAPALRYPDDCVERLARLRKRVAGRDILLFGFGPSLQLIAENTQALQNLDFVSMTLTTFPIIEESVLHRIGRHIDIACITHPRPLDQLRPAIFTRGAQAPRMHLAVPLWIRDPAISMGNEDLLNDGPADIVWFDTTTELPPSPALPLNFPGINTLACALSVALLAQPRRVFLFGFDGGIRGADAQESGSLYFRETDQQYHAPARKHTAGREATRANLWWDSMRFNETAPVALRHVALLFDVPIPPIYNVCPDSFLEPFPRISFAQFQKIVGEPRESNS